MPVRCSAAQSEATRNSILSSKMLDEEFVGASHEYGQAIIIRRISRWKRRPTWPAIAASAAFIRAFSREFGVTPLRWRKLQSADDGIEKDRKPPL